MEHFSDRENEILKIIGRRAVTLNYISVRLFLKAPILDPKIAVANSVTRIIRKCKHHKLKWTLEKTREFNKLTIKRKVVK